MKTQQNLICTGFSRGCDRVDKREFRDVTLDSVITSLGNELPLADADRRRDGASP